MLAISIVFGNSLEHNRKVCDAGVPSRRISFASLENDGPISLVCRIAFEALER